LPMKGPVFGDCASDFCSERPFPAPRMAAESFNSAWGDSNLAGMRLRLKNELPTVQVMHMSTKSLRAKIIVASI
jgi:hypothetical protein